VVLFSFFFLLREIRMESSLDLGAFPGAPFLERTEDVQHKLLSRIGPGCVTSDDLRSELRSLQSLTSIRFVIAQVASEQRHITLQRHDELTVTCAAQSGLQCSKQLNHGNNPRRKIYIFRGARWLSWPIIWFCYHHGNFNSDSFR
jgi:hypothetical protein